jgi:hypothetical protein
MEKVSFEETLTEVWRQALVENAKALTLEGESYTVRRTPKRGLRQVDFTFVSCPVHHFSAAQARRVRLKTSQLSSCS